MEDREERKKSFIEFWKRMLFYNVGIKLVSIICAVVFWLLITNIADPYKTKNFSVTVQTIHEDAISSVNQVYEIISGQTASVSIRGRRSVVDKLDESDISATADLSNLSKVNAVPIKISVSRARASDISVDCNDVLKIALEEMEKKQIKVIVNCEGTPASDYAVGECIAKPNVIEVTGGESVIDRIATVEVSVNVNGASESFRKTAEPVAYDQKHHKITSATLSFNTGSVRTVIKLVQKKEVSVKIQIDGTPAEGYEFIEVNSSPETIEVAGKQKDLAEISTITIPVDITGLREDSSELEQNIDISEYISSELTVPNEEDRNVSVKITILRMQTKKIELSGNQITIENLRSGYTAEIDPDTETVSVSVRGAKKALSVLSNQSVTGIVDCSGYREGEHMLPVEIDLGDDYILEETVRVNVIIRKRG
ncbi:MAG: hypothetical protein IJ733_11655 [Lachnospiraceae bacterium]|nr:hypothetical protein [Lachnospiraceae bacterium]